MHKSLGFGKPPAAIAGPSLLRPAELLKPAPVISGGLGREGASSSEAAQSQDSKPPAPPLGLTAEELREDFGTKLAAARIAARDTVRDLHNRISTRLNNHLCEMKEGYDDSIVGFNEAWDIVRAAFAEALGEKA